jgi:hypothetical protein
MHAQRTLRPDSKGRISLGHLASSVSGFKMAVDEQHRIILEPLVEIPAREKWLFDNPTVLRQVQKGIDDAAKGKVFKKDFSEYLSESGE